MSDHLTGFRARLQAGPTAFAAWCAMREPAVAETILKEGFDCAVLDWQHGYHDQASIEAGILIAQAYRKPAMVRIGVGDFAGAARFLDWGAVGIIAPMINSAADAKALVDFLKYPPLGPQERLPSGGYLRKSTSILASAAELIIGAIIPTAPQSRKRAAPAKSPTPMRTMAGLRQACASRMPASTEA